MPIASWENLESADPGVARVGRMLLTKHGRAFLGTVRRDGSPRISALCPVLSGGKLIVGIVTATPKYHDLNRDRRCVLHAMLGPSDTEFCVDGLARPIPPAERAALAASDPALRVSETSALFEIGIVRAWATLFGPGPDGLAVPDRRIWTPETAEALR